MDVNLASCRRTNRIDCRLKIVQDRTQVVYPNGGRDIVQYATSMIVQPKLKSAVTLPIKARTSARDQGRTTGTSLSSPMWRERSKK
ncbi:hypothetical protein GWI33_014466 [Rhynchophorus ferrugineus]|uniref:Uncharacterized protein n=1 Tax=Rhynchophorus ferrugineus TaxID=354439 RepID=A0A834I621_RHYFE|nr:hypothetical protein GWI33_014466 [Rhynchophorus ferrugineus]